MTKLSTDDEIANLLKRLDADIEYLSGEIWSNGALKPTLANIREAAVHLRTSTPSPASSSEGYVTVARGLLDLCLGVIEEVDKHGPITGSNFDDDVKLALGQLRLALASPHGAASSSDANEIKNAMARALCDQEHNGPCTLPLCNCSASLRAEYLHQADATYGIVAARIALVDDPFYDPRTGRRAGDPAPQSSSEIAELRDALTWIAKIADANYEQDEKLRSRGARTLKRIAERAESALSKLAELEGKAP